MSSRVYRDKFGMKAAFGQVKKGRTKNFTYKSMFYSGQMVLDELQGKVDRAMKNGPCYSIPVSNELKERYLRK